MAKTPGATLYTSNHASGSGTLSSFLYAGRGRLRHHAGISGFGCWAGVGPAKSPASENAKRINRFKEVFSSNPRLLLFFRRECVSRRNCIPRSVIRQDGGPQESQRRRLPHVWEHEDRTSLAA